MMFSALAMVPSSHARRIPEYYAVPRIELGVPDELLAILSALEHLHEVARFTPVIAEHFKAREMATDCHERFGSHTSVGMRDPGPRSFPTKTRTERPKRSRQARRQAADRGETCG